MEFLKQYRWWLVSFGLAIVLYSGYALTIAPPSDFPVDKVIIIAHGESVSSVADQLEREHLVAHPTLLRILLRLTGTATAVPTGAYLFHTPQNLITIAYRLSAGAYDIPPVRITFVEGITVRESGLIIANALQGVTESDFTLVAQQYEGYLFPDTYLFQPGADTGTVVTAMRENFNMKISSLGDHIQSSGHSLSEIVIMASLLEKEARTTEVRRIVSGILWHRLALGMPLQVDAVFGYIFNKDTYSPSYADLKVDSPYNTYIHTGLPPGPINNPGLDSLSAAISPTKTNYLYYLTGSDNLMHYATTYQGQLINQKKYLK